LTKILILGGTSLIGSTFAQYAKNRYDLYLTTHSASMTDLDFNTINVDILKNANNIVQIITDYKPHYVIHCVAFPNVDFCETNQNLANILHVERTKDIAKISNKIGAKLIYFSTDAVFDGNLSRKYKENDSTNPLSHYGKTKLKSEKILLDYKINTVLRTTVVYGWHQKSRFTNWVINSLKNNQSVGAFIDQQNTPTLVDDIAKVLVEIIENDISGLYHVSGSTCLSRNEFALKIANKFELNNKLISPTSSDKQKQLAPRPKNGCLDNSYCENTLDFKFHDIDSGIDVIYEKSKINNF
jgi:dTDP-4-dehydrorhamnose reductase